MVTTTVKVVDCELIDVAIQDDKAVMTFKHPSDDVTYDVVFDKRVFDTKLNRYREDDKKARSVDMWCVSYFNTSFNNLHSAIGMKRDVYAYKSFNSLWEITRVDKYQSGDVGRTFTTEILEVIEDDVGIKIRFEDNGLRESNMSCTDYDPSTRKYKPNAKKRQAQCSRFTEKFGISITNMHQLAGRSIDVTIKSYSGHAYATVELSNGWCNG